MKLAKLTTTLLVYLIILMPLSSSALLANPLIISNVQLTDFTQTSVKVSWTTDVDADSKVLYGETTPAIERANPAYSRQHSIIISTEAGKSYKYQLQSCTPANECAATAIDEFVAGPDTTAPVINVTIPAVVNAHRINIRGVTEPYSEVQVIVNGVLAALQSARSVGANGIISLGNVGLGRIENDVEIMVKDSAGNSDSKTFSVKVDIRPPSLQIVNFPDVAADSQITVNGNVDERSAVEFYVRLEGDAIAPSKVAAVQSDRVDNNLVRISWTASDAADLLEYAVYRNDERIATATSTNFEDNNVTSNQTYRYRVAAVDKSCNEGVLSDALSVTIPPGGPSSSGEYAQVRLSCELPVATIIDREGSFAQLLDLSEGQNKIRVIAKDAAGNKAVYENISLYDSQDPSFESDNLGSLSPSYIPEVHVKGKVSEKAAVFVYINGHKTIHWGLTDDLGNFNIKVALERKSVVIGDAETAWHNLIKLVAVDLAGRAVETPEVDVIYATCGYGTDFQSQMTDVSPADLTPRDIVEGFAVIGFNIKLADYDTTRLELRSKSVRLRPLSAYEKDKWDVETVTVDLQQWSPDGKTAAITLNIKEPAYPADADTIAEKVDFIAEHRKGECGIPDFGCYKIPLELEIRYNALRQRSPAEQQATGLYGPEITEKIQKSCMEVMVGIQPSVPIGDTINKKFLKNRVMDLDNAIDFLDKMLEPLETIYSVIFNSCLAVMALEFVYDLWTETYELFMEVVPGKRDFDRNIARSGLCDEAYPIKDVADEIKKANEKKNSNCNSFARSTARLDRIKRARRHLCDRVFCPSAPTLRKYIIDKQKESLKPLPKIGRLAEFDLYAGSDCGQKTLMGFPMMEPSMESSMTGPLIEESPMEAVPREIMDAQQFSTIKNVYDSYQKHHHDGEFYEAFAPSQAVFEGDLEGLYEYGEEANTKAVNCAKLHPSTPACCGYEYMKEWGTACDLPGFYELTFSEMKESLCIAAQQSGVKVAKCQDLDLRTLTNAISGICTPETSIKGVRKLKEIVPTGFYYQPGVGGLDAEQVKKLETSEVFVLVDVNEKTVKRGYVGFKYEFSDAEALDGKRVFVSDGPDLTRFFRAGIDPKYDKSFDAALECSKFPGCDSSKAERIFNAVKSKFIAPEKEYAVDPTSGFFRTLQCVCLPGFMNYVKLWRNTLMMARNCLEQLRVTGHGSEGVCESFITTYLCDLIWDAIKCVYYTFGGGPITGSMDVSAARGPSNIFEMLVQAGDKISGSTQERYGKASIFQTLFSERTVVHSMCLFAFTGKFDLPEALSIAMEQSLTEIPTNSQGLIAVAERRFFNYDIASIPKGQAAYNYRVSAYLNAGADLNYVIKLRCSDDMSCKEASGHKMGRCDCVGIGAQEQVITPQGSLKKLDVFNEEIYHPPAPKPYRYDKAIIEWTYTDKDGNAKSDFAEKNIHEAGAPPAFCSFNPMELKFLCAVGPQQHYAKFTADPVPVYSPQEGNFRIAEDILFDISLQQSYPDISVNVGGSEHTKYLIYEVYNRRNEKVLSNWQANTDPRQNPTGAQIITITTPAPLSDQFELKNNGPSVKRVSLGKLTNNLLSLSSVEFAVSSTPLSGAIRVIVVDSAKVNSLLMQKFNQPITYTKSGNQFSTEGRSYTYSANAFTDTYYGIRVENIPANVDTITITPRQLTTPQCQPGSTEVWTVKFEIHEAIKEGGEWKPGNQITNDISGYPQQKRAIFNVKCEQAAAQPPAPQPAIAAIPTISSFTSGSIFIEKSDKAKFIVVNDFSNNPELKGKEVIISYLSGDLKDMIIRPAISVLLNRVYKLNVGDEWTDIQGGGNLRIEDLLPDSENIQVSWFDIPTNQRQSAALPTTRLGTPVGKAAATPPAPTPTPTPAPTPTPTPQPAIAAIPTISSFTLGSVFIEKSDKAKFKVLSDFSNDPNLKGEVVLIFYLSGDLKDRPIRLQINALLSRVYKLNVGDEWTDVQGGGNLRIEDLLPDDENIQLSWFDIPTNQRQSAALPTTRLGTPATS